jgi:glutamine cyclotransferase
MQYIEILGKAAAVMRRLAALSLAAFMTFLSALTLGIDALSAGKRHPEVSKDNVLLIGAAERSQGITTDGKYYYFSSKWGLTKSELDGKTRVKSNPLAIPKKLKDEYGLAHIGGISYSKADNCIYAGLEDSKVWEYPVVAVYDADTLKFTGRYYILDKALHTRGLPWVAVDNDRGLLITLDHSKKANELIFYDIADNMKYVGSVKLSETVRSIQGAEMYGGMLYAATNDDTQAVYKIDPKSGEVSKYFDRNLTKGSEGEGITVLETADGAVFHAIDMGPLFINAFIRHYAPIEDGGQ